MLEPGCAKLLLVAGRCISQTLVDPIDVPGHPRVHANFVGLRTFLSPTNYASQFRRSGGLYCQWSTAVTLTRIFASHAWAGTDHVFGDSTVISTGIVAGQGWNEGEFV